ncbi:Uncharacterised protein [Legionella sainthelensi]|nr:Uncharacterised protein [Legionella sainthelensi]
MLYRFFINYFRLKLLRIIVNRIRHNKRVNTKNLKIISK